MAWFALYGWDGAHGAERRKVHRDAHIARLRKMSEGGRILTAGPLTDGAGSLVVADFEGETEARAWLEADAYVTGGVFERIAVHPYKQVFPEQ